MAVITIRNFDDALKRELKVRAAQNDRSMEEEAREILHASLAQRPAADMPLGTMIRHAFARDGGVELEIPAREPMRDPAVFQ